MSIICGCCCVAYITDASVADAADSAGGKVSECNIKNVKTEIESEEKCTQEQGASFSNSFREKKNR